MEFLRNLSITDVGRPRLGIALATCLVAGCGDDPVGPGPSPVPEITRVASVAVPANYGLHDTFVRDGIAFLSVWNTGVTILDVGGGEAGGTPAAPVEITTFQPSNGSLSAPAIHNAWWFHNPVTTERRYLFLGQEGPAVIGSSASGDLKVLDVTDLSAPEEVAFYRVAGAGAHNFWMDEAQQVLYAAFYNGGVAALDVSGVLAGDLASRELARVQPGGAGNTYVWGVMLAGDRLWASDMVSGFWALHPSTLATLGGGGNVPERFGSDLWVHGSYAYTGTWGGAPRSGNFGNMLKIWQVTTGAPVLVETLIFPGVRTISDVEVSDDGAVLVVSAEGDAGAGLYAFRLTDPSRPELAGFTHVSSGLHTASLARIDGRLYAFAARNPPSPALHVYDVSSVIDD